MMMGFDPQLGIVLYCCIVALPVVILLREVLLLSRFPSIYLSLSLSLGFVVSVHYSRSGIAPCEPVPIGECGEAMQTSTCNECGERIGGVQIDNPKVSTC